LASADALAAQLHQYVTEEQLFRIDHYLGKEPVQDLTYLRFGNSLLEPVWNRKYVRSIMITMAEEFGVDDRGSFYDAVGTLRDVVQNHLLQVLALTGLEPPTGGSLSSRRLDFFRSVQSVDPAHVVRGQYAGYRDIPGVAPDSTTETFVALKLVLQSWRWSQVPVYIRAGKKMPLTATEIVVRLYDPPVASINRRLIAHTGHDDIVLRIGDRAGVSISLRVKHPGTDRAEPQMLDLDFATSMGEMPTPYERLLTDAMNGNNALFPSQDVIDETWRIVQPLIDAPPPVEVYQPGTWGPETAHAMPRHVGGWRTPSAMTD
jgi:glucose-6-phosphate 1-dehydrogenase